MVQQDNYEKDKILKKFFMQNMKNDSENDE